MGVCGCNGVICGANSTITSGIGPDEHGLGSDCWWWYYYHLTILIGIQLSASWRGQTKHNAGMVSIAPPCL
jgi:hypothetical protein